MDNPLATDQNLSQLETMQLQSDGSARPNSRSLGELTRRAAGGAFWSTLSFIAGKVIILVNTIVLARLLTPADFGIVSFAMILIGALTLLQDLGVPAALIYDRRGIEVTAGTALSINLLAASLFCLLAIGLAPVMAMLGGESTLAWITVALSFGLLINALGSVQNALMMRDLAFRRRIVPEISSVVVEGVVSITLAILGFGVWSLVIGYLCMAVTATTLLWFLSPVRPVPRWNRSVARDLLGYGKHVSFNSILGFGANNIDYLIVGNILGARVLGLYTMAFTLATLPAVALTQVAGRVIFPICMDIRDDKEKLSETSLRVFTAVSAVAIIAFIVTVIAGPTYMTVLLGEKWRDIRSPLQLLAIYGVLRAIGTVFPPMYKALGRPDIEWRLTLGKAIAVTILLLIGVQYGIRGVAIGQIVGALIFTPVAAFMFLRLSQTRAHGLVRAAAQQVASCGVCLAIVLVWSAVTHNELQFTRPGQVSLVVAVVVAAYCGCMALLNPRMVRQALKVIPIWSPQRG